MSEYAITQVFPGDKRTLASVDALLHREGITRDANLDYISAMLDEDGEVIATGSCFGNTLRCFAVSSDHQGEGLLNEIVSHLMEYQLGRGNSHLFLYTKVKAARFFESLGFYEIARVEGTLVFMENRRNGFPNYLKALEKTARPGVSAAIVMNANPFTLGHRYLVETAGKQCDTLHVFVLSEDASLVPFAVRRQLVLNGTADIPNVSCYETGPYMISSATFPSYFLRDEREAIIRHAQLDARLFIRIGAALGLSARCVGEEPSSLVTGIYNDVLAKCLPEAGIACVVIPRLELNGMAVSASTVRQLIHDGRLADIRPLVPQCTWDYFNSPEAQPVIARMIGENEVKHY